MWYWSDVGRIRTLSEQGRRSLTWDGRDSKHPSAGPSISPANTLDATHKTCLIAETASYNISTTIAYTGIATHSYTDTFTLHGHILVAYTLAWWYRCTGSFYGATGPALHLPGGHLLTLFSLLCLPAAITFCSLFGALSNSFASFWCHRAHSLPVSQMVGGCELQPFAFLWRLAEYYHTV